MDPSMSCECSTEENNINNFPDLQVNLPPDYAYHVCMFKALHNGYDTEFRLKVKDVKGAKTWLEAYTECSKVTYRIQTTKPIKQPKRNIFKTYYRCHHNTLPRSQTADSRKSSKNTSCPARMTIIVRKVKGPGERCRAKTVDKHLHDLPMIVRIQHTHNHLIHSADSLKFRDVSQATIDIFRGLFSRGHSPSSALNTHKIDLQLEYGTDYIYEAGDQAKCPSLAFCHQLYKKIFNKCYGSSSGEKMIHDLEIAITSYNKDVGDVCAKVEEANGNIAIAICTPMMKRIHQNYECSGELVFIDASGGVDRYDCRIFMILTHSFAGGLPLGCLVTTSESKECITLALNLYRCIVPSDAFYGRGSKGPLIFLTDDSESERGSLRAVYPESTLLLCIFHVLQAMWRYLWEAKNRVSKEHRPHLLFLVKAMAYAKDIDDLTSAFNVLKEDEVSQRYCNFIEHCEKLFGRRMEWAICYREDLRTRGNNTNNYAEAAMRILKDHIFERVRAYNIVQLLDFLLTRMPNYYERRLTDIANGRIDMTLSKKYLPTETVIEKDKLQKIGETTYECKSQTKAGVTYFVDMSISTCSCAVGLNGAPCKHQFAVVHHFGVTSLNFVPLQDKKMREHMLFLATGLKVNQVKPNWLLPLRQMNTCSHVSSSTSLSLNVDSGSNGKPREAVQNSSDTFAMVACNEVDVPGVGNNEGKLEELESSFMATADMMVSMLHDKPEQFKEPIQQFNSLKTESAMIGALKTFGKYTGASLSLCTKKKEVRRTKERKSH